MGCPGSRCGGRRVQSLHRNGLDLLQQEMPPKIRFQVQIRRRLLRRLQRRNDEDFSGEIRSPPCRSKSIRILCTIPAESTTTRTLSINSIRSSLLITPFYWLVTVRMLRVERTTGSLRTAGEAAGAKAVSSASAAGSTSAELKASQSK